MNSERRYETNEYAACFIETKYEVGVHLLAGDLSTHFFSTQQNDKIAVQNLYDTYPRSPSLLRPE